MPEPLHDRPPSRTADHTPADSTPGLPPTTGPDSTDAGRGAPGPTALPHVPGYQIIGELGRGGMGVVYHARQEKLNREVALKMILGGRAEQKDLIRFLAEAEAVAAIRHANVVQVYEYGEHEGQPFMALEFLAGGSLSRPAPGAGRTATDAAALLEKIARGVAAAHDAGIVHRDLKPANVLFDPAGEPKVADFGLARKGFGADLTQVGAVMGTPAYMAPEQAAGYTKFVGPEADVWALGVILYERLAGERPFGTGTTPELLARIQTAEPAPLRNAPRDLALIVRKCLEKTPSDRYPTAKELADDLGRFVRREPISIRPAGLLERGYKWARRKPALAGLSVAIPVIAVLAGVAWLLADANAKVGVQRDEADRERGSAETARGEAVIERGKAEALRDEAKAAREALTTLYYYRQVERAHAAWLDRDVLRAIRLLVDTAPDRRDWEWRYVARLCRPESRLIRADSYVMGAAVSPDGRSWVGAVEDKTARVWDAETGEERLVYRGHTAQVQQAVFHPDGRRVLTLDEDGSVHVWEAATGKTLQTFKLPGGAGRGLALSPDGKQVAAGSRTGEIRVWDLGTEKQVASMAGHRGWVNALLFAPGGRLLSVSIDGTLRAWDVTAGQRVGTPREHRSAGIGAPLVPVWAVAVRPEGKHILTGDENGRVYTWDAATLEPVSQFQAHDSRVWSVAFSQDGTRVLTASLDQTAKLWDAKASPWRLARTFYGHTNDVIGAAFLTGDRVMTYGDHTVRVFDATRDADARVLSGVARFEGVAFGPDGRLVAAASPAGVFVWEAGTGKAVGRFGGAGAYGRAVAFSPDGTAIAGAGTGTGAGKVHVWPLGGGPPRVLAGHPGPVLAVAFARNDHRLASTGGDGTVKVWGTDPEAPVWSAPAHPEPLALAFSPDGKLLATGGGDNLIRLWDAADGRPVGELRGHTLRVSRVSFSPDGKRLASGSHDNTVRVWDVAARKEEFSIKGHVHYIDGVAFSPDGRRLADAAGDKTVRLYDTRTREGTLTLKGHTDWVTGVAFSPDGARIATCSRDGTVRVWDAPLDATAVVPPEADQSTGGN